MRNMNRCGGFLIGLVLAQFAGLPAPVAKAEDAPKPPVTVEKPVAEKPATTPTTGRSKETILADLNAAGTELRGLLKSPNAFSDEKQRAELAPKAIPVMKKFLVAFDELVAQDPMAKAQSGSVHGQFLSMLTVLGDADAEKRLSALAGGDGTEAVDAKGAMLMANWWRNSKDAVAQKKLIDDARSLLKANAMNDSVAMIVMQMAEQGAASPELKDAAEKVVVDEAKGPRSKMLVQGIQATQKLKAMEGKELVIAGVTNEGRQFTTADWKGKVILVDFWATWCGPCRAELPRVKKAYADFHPKGLEILGVSCDRDPAALKAFLTENKDMPWTQLFDEKTPGWHPLATQYGIEGIPTMFLIDKKGIVRSITARENFETEIPKMLDEK